MLVTSLCSLQKFYDQLREDNLIPTEFQPENIPSGKTHCSELLEVLQEPKFGVFESEYQLLGQLSLVCVFYTCLNAPKLSKLG